MAVGGCHRCVMLATRARDHLHGTAGAVIVASCWFQSAASRWMVLAVRGGAEQRGHAKIRGREPHPLALQQATHDGGHVPLSKVAEPQLPFLRMWQRCR